MGFGFKLPSPSQVLLPPAPPKSAPFAATATKAYNFMAAPARSTIAADPLLSWAEKGHFTNHRQRTREGIHQLYKEDRLAQRIGIREKDVVTAVEVVEVVVAIYFAWSFASELGSAGGSAAGGGTASGGGVAAATATPTVAATGGLFGTGYGTGVASVDGLIESNVVGAAAKAAAGKGAASPNDLNAGQGAASPAPATSLAPTASPTTRGISLSVMSIMAAILLF